VTFDPRAFDPAAFATSSAPITTTLTLTGGRVTDVDVTTTPDATTVTVRMERPAR
jgi:hypothetical protein